MIECPDNMDPVAFWDGMAPEMRDQIEREKREARKAHVVAPVSRAEFDALKARVDALEGKEGSAAKEALDQLEAAKDRIDTFKAAEKEPPAELSDLFEPNLTARENHDALTKKYKDAMSEHYRLMGYGTQEDRIEAQRQLEKAQRIESGINWNRARLAEVL